MADLNNDDSITRRDYLNSTLLGTGSALLGAVCPMHLLGRQNDFDGYSGIGDYRGANGNTLSVLTAGHKIRDRVFDPLPKNVIDTGEVFDCVVVGGGISGLAAALAFQRQAGAGRTCLVLENHSIFGGEARRNEFVVDGQHLIAHQGSAMFFPQFEGSVLDGFYRSIGLEQNQFHYQTWTGTQPEMALGNTPYAEDGRTLGFYFGQHFQGDTPQPHAGVWVVDPWGKKLQGAPLSEDSRQQFLKTRVENPAFRAPERHGDAVSRYLDSITLEQHLMELHGIRRETVRRFLSPVSGGGSGTGADALSAYADYAADVLLPWDKSKQAQMFPGGNAGVARLILKALIPDAFSGRADMAGVANSAVRWATLDRPGQASRIRLNATAIHVGQNGKAERPAEVSIVYTLGPKLYRVRARSVVMAGGSWTTKHIVKDLPASHREAYAQFHRSPCVMANVAVRNWRFLYKLGINQFQWFGAGPGNYTAVHKTATMAGIAPDISPDSPVVLSIKILFSKPGLSLQEQGVQGRTELLATPFSVYESQIRSMLAEMFSRTGFEQSDVAGIVLNRWGHAYLSAQPGFFFGSPGKPAPGEVPRNNPVGRICFANSDLTGIMDHRCSILEAHRAVTQALERLV